MDSIGHYISNLTFNEFIFGKEFIQEQAKIHDIEFVSLNMNTKDSNNFWKSYILHSIGNTTIGITGITTLEYRIHSNNTDYEIQPGIEAVSELIPELQKKADIIIVLAYIDLTPAIELAKNIEGIDLLIVGGKGKKLMKPYTVEKTNTTIFKAESKCKYVGKIDLQIENDKIQGVTGSLIPLSASIPDHPKIRKIIDHY